MTTRIPTAADFERAQADYIAVRFVRPTWSELIARGLHAARYPIRAIGCIVAALLCCMILARCSAVEIPDRIIAALVQVESGCEWRGIGDIKGKWARGDAGEVSAFQIAPAALTDMGVTNHTRVHRDTIYAESLARLWLSRCYERRGNWPQALAEYNAGSRYRSRTARDYADRILNLASVL